MIADVTAPDVTPATMVLALDDGVAMTIPAAWDAWTRNGIVYRRLRESGTVIAIRDGIVSAFDRDRLHWRPARALSHLRRALAGR